MRASISLIPFVLMVNLVWCNFRLTPSSGQKLEQELDRLGFALFVEGVSDPIKVGIIINKTREITADTLERFPQVRFIVVFGNEDWMISSGRFSKNIEVVRLGVERGFEVAEHAMGLMLFALKRLNQVRWLTHTLSRKGLLGLLAPTKATEESGHPRWLPITSGIVRDQVVGIVGYGLIGREIHLRLIGFKPRTVYYVNTIQYSPEVESRIGASYCSIEELFEHCDIIFMQLPYSERSEQLINRFHFNRSKPGLILVNCGRAAVINKDDLFKAIKKRQVGFYAADVFWQEPMPLLDRYRWNSRTFISPHMAESIVSDTDYHRRLWMDRLIEELPRLAQRMYPEMRRESYPRDDD